VNNVSASQIRSGILRQVGKVAYKLLIGLRPSFVRFLKRLFQVVYRVQLLHANASLSSLGLLQRVRYFGSDGVCPTDALYRPKLRKDRLRCRDRFVRCNPLEPMGWIKLR
jgi:hypothetical protein